jgi:hypothetical protein
LEKQTTMRKQPEMKTHWGKHSRWATPMQTEMAMQWVMRKQKPTATAMKTPPPRHRRQTTHPNVTQTPPKVTLIRSPHPGTHSAPMKLPAKPPGMRSAPLASSLVLALRPHLMKLTHSATPKEKK